MEAEAEAAEAGSAPAGAGELAVEGDEGAPLSAVPDDLGGDALTEADARNTDDPASADGDPASANGELGAIDPGDAEVALLIPAPGSTRALASQPALAGALEPIEAEPRPPRSSRWGQLDLTVAWHRAYDATDQGSSRRDELWLLAIWRR